MLTEVGGSVEIRSTCESGETLSLSLPALSSIERSLDVHDNPGLLSLELDALTRIGQDLVITANPILSSVELGSLGPGAISGEVFVTNNESYPQDAAEAICVQTASSCDGVYGNGG